MSVEFEKLNEIVVFAKKRGLTIETIHFKERGVYDELVQAGCDHSSDSIMEYFVEVETPVGRVTVIE